MKYIIALDQGTTSSRTIVFDQNANIVTQINKEFKQIYPQAGWVEHDPLEIWGSQESSLNEAIAKSGIDIEEIATIGITNQRETTFVWDKNTGKPVYNAIVWQCRRTSSFVDMLKLDKEFAEYVKDSTGLVLDAYFSGTKIKWILDNVSGARQKAENGQLLFGTSDTWLLWKLTNGKVHKTDFTNASRTLIFNIKEKKWDKKILDKLGIPECMLPEVHSSAFEFGKTFIKNKEIPIAGIAGDQQAALFGQTCFNQGDVKNTYGTGCFTLIHTGSTPLKSSNGLLTTMVCSVDDKPQYALEGSIFIAGAVIQWLRDELEIIKTSEETEDIAFSVKDTNGVYIVPAFVGLGSPYWDQYARGSIMGLTRGVNKKHIIRAALESIAYQSKDLILAMEQDIKKSIKSIKVDGGASKNNFIMQFQADIMDATVLRPKIQETTALGAAFLAGLTTGIFKGLDDLTSKWNIDKEFVPDMNHSKKNELYNGWKKAISRTKDWISN